MKLKLPEPAPPNSLGFQEQSGGYEGGSRSLRKVAEQLGISGTVRRAVAGFVNSDGFGRTAWDFRNSQAGMGRRRV